MSHPDPTGAVVGGFVLTMFLLWAVAIAVGIAAFAFWIVEIIDVARREFFDPNAKVMWLLIVILLHGIGALIYYFVGKPQGRLPGEGSLPPRAGY